MGKNNSNNETNITGIDFDKLIDTNNNTIIQIFDLVKSHQWEKLEKIIKITDIDLNIKDNTNTYLLEYVIMFYQKKLIDLLLEKKVRIDITDDNSKSILYHVIKFSYIDILIKLLDQDKITVGKSILEIKDKEDNIPLFYAIKFFNLQCVEIILKYTNNFYIKNIDGDNALHLAIKSENFDLFKLISSYFNDLKSRNSQGESYLHIIIKYKCYDILEYFIEKYHTNSNFTQILNYVEFKYNFTILHYISISLDIQSLLILSHYKLIELIEGNIQDNSGNIFYHYFINNIINIQKLTVELVKNIMALNDIFKKIKFNINLYNIDGNTSAHIFFSNINFFSTNNLYVLINWIGEKIDMNIQNFEGESVFYIIVKNNYWKQINNILINKKLDIFIIAEDSKIIFDFIEKKDYDEFLKIITQSYLNQLVDPKTSTKWIDYWDNRCKKIVKLNDLNETELELIKNIGITSSSDVKDKSSKLSKLSKSTKSDENICYDIIYNKLIKSIENFIDTKDIFENNSYPVSNKFIKLISNYPTVVISTFSGSTIDVLSGLIYLGKKFNETKKNYLTSSLDLLKNKDDIIDCSVNESNLFAGNKNHANKSNKVCEIIDFEILWINKNILVPSSKTFSIDKIIQWMGKNKSTDIYRWFVIPLGIEQKSYSHANYIIVDLINMEIERFEPHGSHHPEGLNYEPDLLDSVISDYFNNLGIGNFNYFKPTDYLEKIGFQIKEINELKSDYIGDPNGFCALWCIWWTDMRLSNPEIPRNKLVKRLNRELINGKYSYKKLIRDYSGYIITIRDKLFLKANTNINEWINDTIPEKNIQLLNQSILEEINNI